LKKVQNPETSYSERKEIVKKYNLPKQGFINRKAHRNFVNNIFGYEVY